MSDYSNDDGAPLPPRKGLHAKPEDLGSLVTDSVRSLITQQPGERDSQNRGYSPQGPSPFSQQQEQHRSEWLDWSRFLGRKNKLLQATSRSRSHGALWPIDECILCLL